MTGSRAGSGPGDMAAGGAVAGAGNSVVASNAASGTGRGPALMPPATSACAAERSTTTPSPAVSGPVATVSACDRVGACGAEALSDASGPCPSDGGHDSPVGSGMAPIAGRSPLLIMHTRITVIIPEPQQGSYYALSVSRYSFNGARSEKMARVSG
ncbi:hypothetical protein GCM10009735_35040 [Actinomadura chokoriensis]